MPAVGYVLLIKTLHNEPAATAALQMAVPGLLVGPVHGAQWPVASWADHPRQVEDHAEAMRSMDFVLDVEVAYVDWRGDPDSTDLQFDWNDLRGGRRLAPRGETAPQIGPS